MAVERYPLDFDGAIAGDPGFDLSHAAIAEAWDTETFNAIAPTDAQHQPILSKAFGSTLQWLFTLSKSHGRRSARPSS